MDKTNFCIRSFYKVNALKIFGAVTFVLTLICTVLSALSRTLFFDEVGYYAAGAIIPKIFVAVCTFSVLIIALFCLVPKLRIQPSMVSNPLPVRIGAFVLAVGFAILLAESIENIAIIAAEELIVWDMQAFSYLILPAILLTLIMVHFIRVATLKDPSGILGVIGNTCFIIFAVSEIGNTYFNSQIPMNSPTVTLLYLALLSAMLLFTNEARVGLEDDKKAYHAFTAAMATLFGMTFCISEACVYSDLINDPKALMSTVVINAYFPIIFFISIFAATRLTSICFITPCEAEIVESSDEPVTDEQVADEPVTDKQVADEQVADEQVADEQNDTEADTAEDVTDTQTDTE